LDRVLGPITTTASVPATVVNELEQALIAQRSVRLLAFPTSDYLDDVAITDADIKAWYEANQQSLQLPEQVSVQYLLLNEEVAMANVVQPSEEDLKKYYEQNKARYVQPARVNVSHIQINVPVGATEEQREEASKKAQALAAKAQADPTGFAALA